MPPELVETGQDVGEDGEDIQQKPVKVPITIVTGELHTHISEASNQ